MDDIKERPSKIRKLGAASSQELLLADLPTSLNDISTSIATPTNDPSQDEQTPSADLEPAQNTSNGSTQPPSDGRTLSKSQMKKIRKREAWDAGKDDRRIKRREKHKEKQARKAAARAELAEQEAENPAPVPAEKPAKVKGPTSRRPIQVPLSLILDCDFNDKMTQKELISLAAQATRCYSDNRSAAYRSHLVISSWGGALQARFDGPLEKNYMSWKGVRFIPENFLVAAEQLNEVMRGSEGGRILGAIKQTEPPKDTNGTTDNKPLDHKPSQPIDSTQQDAKISESTSEDQLAPPPEQEYVTVITEPTKQPPIPSEPLPPPSLIYLTSDSPHTLDVLSPYTSYIIGGIVDKNRHKGLCYKRACQLGIPTAKLPIGEYMTMQSRTVLAVNHVVEIMLRWLEVGDWGEAFLKVIPKRKEARLRSEEVGHGSLESRGRVVRGGRDDGDGSGSGSGDSGMEDVE